MAEKKLLIIYKAKPLIKHEFTLKFFERSCTEDLFDTVPVSMCFALRFVLCALVHVRILNLLSQSQ